MSILPFFIWKEKTQLSVYELLNAKVQLIKIERIIFITLFIKVNKRSIENQVRSNRMNQKWNIIKLPQISPLLTL